MNLYRSPKTENVLKETNIEDVLMKAVDDLNKKFGKDTVRFGSVKTEGNWKMKQTRKSQSYTTNWNEILLVS